MLFDKNNISLKAGLKICVLQPDYSTSDVDYQYYDPRRDLSHLLPDAHFEHVFLNKLTTYKQLKGLKKKNFDIFVNLCEGYLEWEIPSIDVIYFMELLNLPYTGPSSLLYDPHKELMKYVAYTEGIKTPAYFKLENLNDIDLISSKIQFPLFVKPEKAGDSLGIDDHSRVESIEQLKQKAAEIIEEYGPLLIEEYIAGREFTVMVAATGIKENPIVAFKPIEYIFPEGNHYKTYALKTSDLHPNANVPVNDLDIEEELKNAAIKIFRSFNGVGYARLDFRMSDKNELYFLEINFTCSVFYKDGYEGSADFILKEDGIGQAGFLRLIVAEGIERHQHKQKKYEMKGNSISGYGIYATKDLEAGEIIFEGEERAQRITTRRHVYQNWNADAQKIFKHYAYPLSHEVYLLWDNDPSGWAPQNHSCNANTGYHGLNVIALRSVQKGEELTLDYATFLDDEAVPFECCCSSENCRKFIKGIKNNSVTERENVQTI